MSDARPMKYVCFYDMLCYLRVMSKMIIQITIFMKNSDDLTNITQLQKVENIRFIAM